MFIMYSVLYRTDYIEGFMLFSWEFFVNSSSNSKFK
jgi:hypothetical protein